MNEINIRQMNPRIFEAFDNGIIIARIEVDENGNEMNMWVHESYNSFKDYIEKALREAIRKTDL